MKSSVIIRQVCVYCASSKKIDERYLLDADALAESFLAKDITLVFGGGSVGLMGRLADRMLASGGRVIGIMPQFMKDVEWAHKGVNDIKFVKDMHERKKRFLDGTDALVALPGGCGTLEELLEAITLKRLGLFVKPIIIVNLDGFYDPLIKMLERCVEERFMAPEHLKMWTIVSDSKEVLPAIYTAPEWDEGAIKFAAV
ncbi:MAG: TIGR00730 family Rossman fold protein [Saprospiraceae bacterium]|jgi:uncharacterized protein (TIGR00730 family)|nr:TIGR00730 family Rossman fold protein [Saprospiraceae bacterium]